MLLGSLAAGGLLVVGPRARAAAVELAVVCPVDGTSFKVLDVPMPRDLFAVAGSPLPPVGVERDLRPTRTVEGVRQALWRCPGCHYAAWRSEFAGPLTDAQKARLKAELKPVALPGAEPAWVTYDLAAKAYAIRGGPHRKRALALCYLVYDLVEGAPTGTQDRGLLLRRMRWSAREAIRLGVAKKEFSGEELCLARYLLAEMTRRGGHFSDAIDDFKKAGGTPACPGWLTGWIEQQASKAKVGIAGDQ
jgi:hypothetical protein